MMAPQGHSAEFQPSRPKRCSVYLAYAETAGELSNYIKSILQSYHLTVYDCHQDVAFGQPPLIAWDRAMNHCSGFVVLVTADYLQQPELVQQFQSIYHLLLEHRVRETDVVLVAAGTHLIPPSLSPLPIIDLLQKHWEQNLEWWAFCFKGEFPNKTVISQVGRDFQRDVCNFLCSCGENDTNTQVLSYLSFVFKMLDVFSKPPGSHSAERGHTGRDCNHPAAVSDRLLSGTTTRQTPSPQSPCRPEDSVPDSRCDREEVRAPANVESAHGADRPRGESAELPLLRDRALTFADPGGEDDFPAHDVFLTYCEESPWDCAVAEEVKAALQGRNSRHVLFPKSGGLGVFDAVRDLLPGRAEVHVTSAAVKSSAFVVLLSPAYLQDPLCRRLHFPQVLRAVLSDTVDTDSVLIIHTSGCAPLRHVHAVDDDDDNDARTTNDDDHDADNNDDDDNDDDYHDDDDGDGGDDSDGDATNRKAPRAATNFRHSKAWRAGEGGPRLPSWFRAFTHVHWSPCLGLCEEGRLTVWARHVRNVVTSTHRSGAREGPQPMGRRASGRYVKKKCAMNHYGIVHN